MVFILANMLARFLKNDVIPETPQLFLSHESDRLTTKPIFSINMHEVQ
jgi:hypothetical protein